MNVLIVEMPLILQGTVIGQVFQDRQALMALYGFINARDRVSAITSGALTNTDAAERNMEVIRDTPSYKVDQATNARDIAFQQSMDKLTPAIGGIADGLTSVMTEYPGYTTAVATATAAVTGLAGAAGLATLAMRGGGIPGLLGKTPGAASGAVTGSVFSGISSALRTMLGPLMLLETLSQPSADDIAALRRMDAEEAANKAGYRGKGFNDPRILGGRLGSGELEQILRKSEVNGEVFVRVSADPGLRAEATVAAGGSKLTIESTGRTNLGAGF